MILMFVHIVQMCMMLMGICTENLMLLLHTILMMQGCPCVDLLFTAVLRLASSSVLWD